MMRRNDLNFRLLLGAIAFLGAVAAVVFFDPHTGRIVFANGNTPPSSQTINAASCNQNDVQSAINGAVSGDTVLVPAGNCTWGNQVTLPAGRDIILKGAGVGKTVITVTGWRALYIASGSGVTGFEIYQDTTYEEIIKVESPGHKRFRIDHC